jgi:hypothetical protein
MTGSYSLNIHGPYNGTFNFTVTDAATGAPVIGAELSNLGSCSVTEADYNESANSTLCEFTLSLPVNYSGSRYIRVTASDASAVIAEADVITAITASSYELDPDTTQTGTIGTDIVFSITPNSVFSGTFSISATGPVSISPASIGFSTADYPTGSTALAFKDFTVTPTGPGIATITVTSPLGVETVDIVTMGTELDIIGPATIQKGTTSGDYTLTINGPYAGTVDIYLYTPASPVNLPAPIDFILSRTDCTFTLADHNPVTNETSCTFTISVPAVPSVHLNYIGLSATAPDLEGDPLIAITANDFELTAEDDLSDIATGTTLTFTIKPNSLFDGTFTLDDGGMGGLFSPNSVLFNPVSWPENTNHTPPSGLTFTYTPLQPGDTTLAVCNQTLGCQFIELIGVHGEDFLPPDTSVFPHNQPDFARVTGIIGVFIAVIGSVVLGVMFTLHKVRKS